MPTMSLFFAKSSFWPRTKTRNSPLSGTVTSNSSSKSASFSWVQSRAVFFSGTLAHSTRTAWSGLAATIRCQVHCARSPSRPVKSSSRKSLVASSGGPAGSFLSRTLRNLVWLLASRPTISFAMLGALDAISVIVPGFFLAVMSMGDERQVLQAVAAVTSAVQLGFIAGTLVFALLNLADRFPARAVFFASAVLGAAANALLAALPAQK